MNIFSSVSSTFVSSIFPHRGENIKIRLLSDVKLEYAILKTDSDSGLIWQYEMNEKEEGGLFWYEKEVSVNHDSDPFRYFFVIKSDDEIKYYSKSGLESFPPNVISRFSLVKDITPPTWVSSSTCYQIFPDRFNNADSTIGAKKGEYELDGATVTTPSFDESPKPYEEAKCLDFYNGDLKGIEEKLSYLKNLGFDALYINPINSSLTVHRFDSTDYFHVDKKLGGDKAYLNLINKCHKMGIRVIIDVSINHTSLRHKWYLKALSNPSSKEREFYYFNKDGKASTWQGVKTLVQLNFNSKKLRNLLYKGKNSALKKYIQAPYNQDGWRLDVAPELGRNNESQLTHDVWREVRKELKSINPNLYLVGEDWDDAYKYLQSDEWDGTMNYFGSGRLIRSWMGEEDRFLSQGWGHSPKKVRPLNAFSLEMALKNALFELDQNNYFQMNLIDSHDTPRLHNNKSVYDKNIYDGALLLLYLLPGMPNIYYGDEIELNGEMGSVEGSRYPMVWDKSKWNIERLEYIKNLGKIRKNDWLSFSSTFIKAIDENVLLIVRFTKDKAYFGFINKSEEDKSINFQFPFIKNKNYKLLIGESELLSENDRYQVKLNKKISSLYEAF